MDKNRFKEKLSGIKKAVSLTGKEYRLISVSGDSIIFMRENKTKPESISINELYDLYSNETLINTTIAKSYISGRVQSPAVAILNYFKSIPLSNYTTERNQKEISSTKLSSVHKSNTKVKDETKFFFALSSVIGFKYLQSKSVSKPIDSSHIFLSDNFIDYLFNKKMNECYFKILNNLKSNRLFKSKSLSHYVDGLIMNHPILKYRIVEFDEEQHFTPARKDTIKHLKHILPNFYFSRYETICNDKTYLNNEVLKKHRIKNKLETIPESFIEFVKWLENSNEKSSGYICNKNGFEFLGGRIAQRAYYDCLRDTAHLSIKNKVYESPLRFAKKNFEEIEGVAFSMISHERLKEIIVDILYMDYGLTILNV